MTSKGHSPRSRCARVRFAPPFLRKGEAKHATTPLFTPFVPKGEAKHAAQRRGDASMHESKAHPPRSPFLRKGEAKYAAAWLFTPFETKGSPKGRARSAAAKRRGDVRRVAGILLALVALSATAAVGPNIQAVQPDRLNNYWVMTNTSLNVDVPNSGVNLSKPTCSAVTYMIGSDGVTRDIVVRNTIPAGDLKTVAASAVKDMHYVPGANNAARSPVFTYIVIPFNLPVDPAARKKITDACVLKDFPNGYR